MELHKDISDTLIPDDTPVGAALARTTHLGIGAHQDDLEIMAYHGIITCFGRDDLWFAGVTCTSGSGAPRAGVYADLTDEDMMAVRKDEQRTAARIGKYGAMLQLGYASKETKDPSDTRLVEDLTGILAAARPQVVYTHSPADKHATHVAVMAAVLKAVRGMPEDMRPEHVYACEVWRDLDWLPDKCKVPLDVSGHENLAAALLGVYDSQIAGGKRYDLATIGRRRANATYFESHGVDTAQAMTFAMDLTPLVRDAAASVVDYASCLIDDFRDSVRSQLEPLA